MIVILINCFSYLLAENFRNNFDEGAIGPGNMQICNTYFRCLINSINLGLRGGGGVSDFLILNTSLDSYSFLGRFFFDIIFFIFINLIFMGMFFGIIVDSFSDYRDNINTR